MSRAPAGRDGATLFAALGRVVPILRPHARRHRGVFAIGAVSALAVVSIRLVLPWLVHALLKPWLSSGGAGIPGGGPPWRFYGIGLLFAALASLLGYADFRSRLGFARFAIGAVRDLRGEAFEASLGQRSRFRARPGDFVARLVGDIARIKTGLKGLLTHVATNGVLFVAVSVVLIRVDLVLGMVFAATVALLVVVTWLTAERIYGRALRYRKKEGNIAEAMRSASWAPSPSRGFESSNRSSGRHEASLTRLQGTATWVAHGLFGSVVAVALILGIGSVQRGHLEPGSLLVFVLYALSIRTPMVQLARQGARIGKIVAAAERVCEVVARSSPADRTVLPAPAERLELTGIKVVGSKARGKAIRIRGVDLVVAAGDKVLVCGPAGSGKTTLLDVLADRERPKKGTIVSDGVEADVRRAALASVELSHLGHRIEWPRQKLRRFLGLPPGEPGPENQRVLDQLGVSDVLGGLPENLDSVVASADLSVGEVRRFALARIALGSEPLVLLDEPFEGLSRGKSLRALELILERRAEATVILAARKPLGQELFDEVVNLKKGRVVRAERPSVDEERGMGTGPDLEEAVQNG